MRQSKQINSPVVRPSLQKEKENADYKKRSCPNDILELDRLSKRLMYVRNSFLTVWFLQITLKYILRVAPDAILPMCLLAHRAQSFNSQI